MAIPRRTTVAPLGSDDRGHPTTADSERLAQEFGSREHHGGPPNSDPSTALWQVYLGLAEKHDKEMSERWEGDTQGILVFTGLFSATIATFLVESYKNLQPDPNDTTARLLLQISSQLAAISNGTQAPVLQPLTAANTFRPSASALRVNAMWFLSLAMSLTCALSATLMQQWARQYLLAAQRHTMPRKRARIRAFLFEGVERFGLDHVVEAIPTLLHVSVFLFFAGLIDFLFSINSTVAWVLSTFAAAGAATYLLCTTFPLIYANSPYQTPLTAAAWYLYHVPTLAFFTCINAVAQTFFVLPHRWADWIAYRAIPKCRARLASGMSRTLMHIAARLSSDIDYRALSWTLESLDEDHEAEQFIAGIPGFLRSEHVAGAPTTMAAVLEQGKGDSPLAFRIRLLLETCGPAHALPPPVRTRRLLVGLRAIWAILRAFPGIHDLWIFGDSMLALTLRRDANAAVAATGRCICALAARNRVRVLEGDGSRLTRDYLATLMEVPVKLLQYALYLPGTYEVANIVGFVSAVLPHVEDEALPDDVLSTVWETLHALGKEVEGKHPSVGSVHSLLELNDEVQRRRDEEEARLAGGVSRRHLALLKLCSLLQSVCANLQPSEIIGGQFPLTSPAPMRLVRLSDVLGAEADASV
ncbi:hypothetical protein FA95DRAFT_1567283 [Auriscalpium vulgare]|uniref:Uncharacterized protein n=1 Tax=Auriscalpium vulgare TaxID=40419 RepID=A0ACB8R6F7_9AGAM|nr:hypothetical protein FA95DRAFT_1567283 [Auriscalpium vulgare]